ncbi:MAG: hypothetical protein PVI09_18030 [Anaerolineae bacterium]|jgi:hypothetical protein
MESKKRYEKPAIKKVALVSEEAVLLGCKISLIGGPGPNSNDCLSPPPEGCKVSGTAS